MAVLPAHAFKYAIKNAFANYDEHSELFATFEIRKVANLMA
jgi:hypothetical protein